MIIIPFCIALVVLLLAGLNQYSRMQRLEWYSDTSAFYKGFSSLLAYVFLLGILVAYLIGRFV